MLIWNLVLIAAPAHGQVEAICAEAAALWIPTETSRERTVVKWTSRSINFEILYSNTSSAAITSTQQELDFLARQSGLNIASIPDRPADLVIAIVPDIAVAAPGMRDFVQQYFQDKARSGRIRIDADGWDQAFRETSPKCSGLNLLRNGQIERAFILMQGDQSADCYGVGLYELFGLINFRKHYKENKYSSRKHATLAFQSLYSEVIRAGMNATDARARLGEVCK